MNKAAVLVKTTIFLAMCAGLGLFMAYMAGALNPVMSGSGPLPPQLTEDEQMITVRAERRTLFERASGSIRPQDETIVSARISAQILSISVREGDSVASGEVLIELDRRDLQARAAQAREAVTSAQAALEEARLDFERTRRLAQQQAASQAALDAARARFTTGQAELDRARRSLDEAEVAITFATLRSPIAGRVTERLADPGDLAVPGAPLLRLYSPGSLRLEANVRESLALGLSEETELRARIDSADLEFRTVIDEIVPRANPASRTVLVKTFLPEEPRLLPGMFGRLFIPLREETVLYIPRESVGHVGQLTFVRVQGSRGLRRRMVRLGEFEEGLGYRVVSGLEAGEEIAASR